MRKGPRSHWSEIYSRRNSPRLQFSQSSMTGLKLDNFRGFPRGSEVIPLGKMTLIFGPNSGGKSTILKAIASFRQSISANLNRVDIREFSWVPTGHWFDLGARASVIHKGFIESQEAGTEFSIGFQFEVSESVVIPMDLVSSKMLEGGDGIELIYENNGRETAYDSDGKALATLPLENMALLPLTPPKNREAGFASTGKHVLIRDLSELSKEDFRDSMAGLALSRGKLMGMFEDIRSVTIDSGGDYDSEFTVKLFGASEALLKRIEKHEKGRIERGQFGPQPFLGFVQTEATSKMATYTFDFDQDEHLARLSRLDLHSDHSGTPFHEIGLKLMDEGSFELSFEDEERQSEMRGWLEANTGVLQRASLIETITELKKKQTIFLRDPMRTKLSDFVYSEHDEDVEDQQQKRREGIDWLTPRPRQTGGRLTEHRKTFEEVQRQVWSSLGDSGLEKFAEGVSKLPPTKLVHVLESLIDVQRTIEDTGLLEDHLKSSEERERILGKYDKLKDDLMTRKTVSRDVKKFLEMSILRNRGPSVAQLEIFLSESKKYLPDATPDDSRDFDALQRFAKQYKAAGRNPPIRHRNSLTDPLGLAIDTIDGIDGLEGLANALRANVGDWATALPLDRISRSWLGREERTSIGHFQSRAFEITSFRHPIMEISPSWANSLSDRTQTLRWLTEEVSNFVTDLDYLGASRLNPRRIYSFSDATLGGSTGDDGYRSIAALAAKMVGKSGEAIHNKDKFNGYLDQVVGMEADFKNIRVTGVAVAPNLVSLLVKPTGSEDPGMALPDVGYGVSQCIPLLGSTLTGKTLLCEEAESNLHPAAQARLMQCLLHSISESEGADSLPQLVLETHSEHFLKSLTNHLARGDGLSDDDVVILFVDSDSDTGETFAERVETDKGEFLQPWPRDRWDDETNPII